jgi:bacterioferritin-associated ferredoxin
MSFDDIQFELGVATQCGQCEGCAREVVAQCCASHPVAALHGNADMVQLAPGLRDARAWTSSSASAQA